MTETRPWMPAMMLREIAEGAPRLDPDTMAHMRGVIGSFAAILKQGQDSGEFRDVHPILAYESIVGPIIINAARERVAAQPARKTQDFPLLVAIPHDSRNRAHPGDGAKDVETMKRRRMHVALCASSPRACKRKSHRRSASRVGHVEATETRLASEAGGRMLTLTVKEGDRVQPGQTILTLDTRDVAARDRSREGRTGRGRSATAAGAGRLAASRTSARRSRRLRPRAPRCRRREPNCSPPSRISSASRRCSRTTRARASSETMRRRGGMWRGIACRPRRAGSGPPRKCSSKLRAGARREEVDAARARVATVTAQIAPLEKSIGDATLSRRSPASSPRSSSKSAR